MLTDEVLAEHGHRDVQDALVEIRLQALVCPDCGHRHAGEATNSRRENRLTLAPEVAMNLWWRSAAVFVLLGCLSSSARANDLGPQDVPDQVPANQVPADEEPFQQQYPVFDWGTVTDVRFAATGDALSVLDGGLRKTRYGAGPGSDPSAPSRAQLFRLSQLSFWMEAHASDSLGVFAHANVEAEPDMRQHRGRVDLVEGFVFFRRQLSEQFQVEGRGGALIPPLSLEHPGAAWTTIYTITPSAVNSWIGEEVHITRGELNLRWTGLSQELAVTGAVGPHVIPRGRGGSWRRAAAGAVLAPGGPPDATSDRLGPHSSGVLAAREKSGSFGSHIADTGTRPAS